MAKLSALFILLTVCLFFFWIEATEPDQSTFANLQTGDLVFQTDRSAQMLAVFFATGSLYTHVGIIKKDSSGTPLVIEAVGPVRSIPLIKWIHDGYGDRLTIKRMRKLSANTAENVVAAAEKYYGKPYDIFFEFKRDKIYCSELVYYAFQDGANIDLGHVQTVSELNLDNFAVRHLLESRWRKDPICQTPDVNSFEKCFSTISKQKIITPVSLARDSRLDTIYDNYGFLPQ